MAVSLLPDTFRVYIPKADLILLEAPYFYKLDMNWLHLQLRELEGSDEGGALPATHIHNPEVTIGGLTYARQVLITAPWSVEFEDGAYAVTCEGANHNVLDRKVFNQVSVNPANSAGLVIKTVGSGVTAQDKIDIAATTMSSLVDAGYSMVEVLRLLAAVAAGSAAGLESGSPSFKSLDGAKDRVLATYANGTRTVIGLDATP